MKQYFFFTYKGAMAHTNLNRLIGNPYHTEYASWLGYLSVEGAGDDEVNYWKQFFCRHQWREKRPGPIGNVGGDPHRMAGFQMNTCIKCGVMKAGPV
jgi:hypothetical protein